MKLFKKLHKSVKKYIRSVPRSLNPFSKKFKQSPLNPVTHGYGTIKKVLKGTRHGRWRSNLAKYSTGASRHPAVFDMDLYGSGVIDSTGYVHNAKTLSQLTGGR